MAPASPDDPTAEGTGTTSATSLSGQSLGEPSAKKRKTGSETQASGRRQAACQTCRLRKVKCDKKRPRCALCNASGALCEYLGEPGDRLSLESATSTILERIDQLRQDLHDVRKSAVTQPQGSLTTSYQAEAPKLTHPSAPAPLVNADTAFEPSRDFLRIPPHRASADTILQWDVYEQRYPPNALIGVLFGPDQSGSGQTPASPSPGLVASPTGISPPDDEQIPSLIDRFLQNVHTKNPILDVESLVKHGRRCADHGIGWDGWSCLVLLACALGSVAKPFGGFISMNGPPTIAGRTRRPSASSARLFANELQQGDSCFTLACRRLGSLKYSMLGAQCYFFAGVYLMYTLRPIESWHYFLQASVFCQFYLRMAHGISDSFVEVLRAPSQALSSYDRKARRLEQSLYWSCFKSECEFRVELPLPQSEISLGEYPNLFPSPPEPITGQDQYGQSVSPGEEELELRQHAMRLCNEEESWYYYLTEIALRRIGNRIINTFFPRSEDGASRSSWLNVRPLLRMAREFEVQVSSWSAHLPPAMQQYETSSIIRAPHLSFRDGDSNSRAEEEEDDDRTNHVSRELSWAIDNRLLEMQTWLYQPFLYYLVHSNRILPPPPPLKTPMSENGLTFPGHGPPPATGMDSRQGIDHLLNPHSPTQSHSAAFTADYIANTMSTVPETPSLGPFNRTADNFDAEDLAILQSLITSGIECSLKTIDVRARGHRHHGLWFDLRSTMSASLILLAIVRSGNAAWIPGGTETLWGRHGAATPGGRVEPGTRPGAPIGGMIRKVMDQFEFWAAEAPDMMRYRDVLQRVVMDVRGS